MAGTPPGRGGRPRKPIELHLAQGTYRRNRHGAWPRHVLPRPTPPWQPSAADVAALGPRARAWLAACLELYRLSASDGLLLLEACRTFSTVESLEHALRTATGDGGASGRRTIERAIVRFQSLFLAQWSALKLPSATSTGRSSAVDNPFARNGRRSQTL